MVMDISATAALYFKVKSFWNNDCYDFVKIRNYFPERPSGAPLHTLSELYDVPVDFVAPPHLRQRIALYAVAEG